MIRAGARLRPVAALHLDLLFLDLLVLDLLFFDRTVPLPARAP